MKSGGIDLTWFSLDNYKRFESMSTREWAGEICNREYLYNDILSGNVDNSQSSIQERINNLSGKLNEKEKLESEIVERLNKTIAKGIAKNEGRTASIRPLQFFHIWQVKYFNKKIFKKHWAACNKIQRMSRSKKDHIAFDNIDDAIEEKNFKHLCVDLKASDEQLKSDFSTWLNYARQHNKKNFQKVLFEQKHFNDWVKYMCIPYIDLYLILKLQGKTATYQDLANLLFPNETEITVSERVRKVTHVKSMGMLNNHISSALHNQADNEDADKIVE